MAAVTVATHRIPESPTGSPCSKPQMRRSASANWVVRVATPELNYDHSIKLDPIQQMIQGLAPKKIEQLAKAILDKLTAYLRIKRDLPQTIDHLNTSMFYKVLSSAFQSPVKFCNDGLVLLGDPIPVYLWLNDQIPDSAPEPRFILSIQDTRYDLRIDELDNNSPIDGFIDISKNLHLLGDDYTALYHTLVYEINKVVVDAKFLFNPAKGIFKIENSIELDRSEIESVLHKVYRHHPNGIYRVELVHSEGNIKIQITFTR